MRRIPLIIIIAIYSAEKLVNDLFEQRISPLAAQVIDVLGPWIHIEAKAVAETLARLYIFVLVLLIAGGLDVLITYRRRKLAGLSSPGLSHPVGFTTLLEYPYAYTAWLLIGLLGDLIRRFNGNKPLGAEPTVIETLSPWFHLETGAVTAMLAIALYGAILVPFSLTADILKNRRAEVIS